MSLTREKDVILVFCEYPIEEHDTAERFLTYWHYVISTIISADNIRNSIVNCIGNHVVALDPVSQPRLVIVQFDCYMSFNHVMYLHIDVVHRVWHHLQVRL